MHHSTQQEHLDRLTSLEQELDDLYGHLGLPKPKFGELSVERLDRPNTPQAARRSPRRSLRKTA